MDTVDKKTRSRIMASVGQRDTGPEMRLRRILHRHGLRYRLHDRSLPGSPDLVFPRFGSVVFVHGCFWHVHDGCKFATKPSSKKKFWKEKFSANRKRDGRNYDALAASGWRVLVVWECAIKGRKEDELNLLGSDIDLWLKSDDLYGEIGGKSDALTKKEPTKRHAERA
jgi:DNA mismatch endonuclease (patch repair protein)